MSNRRTSLNACFQFEALENRFCMSASPMVIAATTSPAEWAATGQDGNDLLIVNNGDGSDFLEGSQPIPTEQLSLNYTKVEFERMETGGRDILIGGMDKDAQAGERDGQHDIIVGTSFGHTRSSREGGAYTDTVQVNGDQSAFHRNNLGLFTLDIGTTETIGTEAKDLVAEADPDRVVTIEYLVLGSF